MSVLRCCKVEFAFSLSGFSFKNIHDSQNSRGRGGYLLRLALSVWLMSWHVFSTAKSLFIGRFRIVLVFVILTIAPLISEPLLGSTRVIMTILILVNFWESKYGTKNSLRAFCSWEFGGIVSPQRVQGRALVGIPGSKAPKNWMKVPILA